MHVLLASSLGITCTAALALTPTAHALSGPGRAPAHAPVAGSAAPAPPLPGSTQSLPLVPLRAQPGGKESGAGSTTRSAASVFGLPARDVAPFSLLGVVWDDPDAEPGGRIEVRTRAMDTRKWSGWRELQEPNPHAPDPGPARRGGTAGLWVGPSDAVQVRVAPWPTAVRATGDDSKPPDDAKPSHDRKRARAFGLPKGMRLELVNPGGPGPAAAGGPAAGNRAIAVSVDQPAPDVSAADGPAADAPVADVPPTDPPSDETGTDETGTDETGTDETGTDETGTDETGTEGTEAEPPEFIGPRPAIVTRAGWHADESLREDEFLYTGPLQAAFVHHTAGTNDYVCSDAPAMIRSMYRYHVESNGWRDLGYNFLVDKCGTIYEGRAGGVTAPVMGAHTLGFNDNSMGIAVLGEYGTTRPSEAALDALARLTAWKLGLYGADPSGTTTMISGGGKFPKGSEVRLNVISGHRDAFNTQCPGDLLYGALPAVREAAARLQGR